MPGRSAQPRHKAPRSATRSASRLAAQTASLLPGRGLLGGVAVVGVAGVAVGIGVGVDEHDTVTPNATSTSESSISSQRATEVVSAKAQRAATQTEGRRLSRSSNRPLPPPRQRETKAAALLLDRHELAGAVTEAVEAAPTDPRDIAASMIASFGWSSTEFSCLDQLWVSESDWDTTATNPSSGAYGIPQSLPAEKMAAAGSDWRTNPATQIEWGLHYIRLSYGTPCSAWNFKQANNWY